MRPNLNFPNPRTLANVCRVGAKGVVINYREGGGLQNGSGGQVKFYPYKNGDGGRKSCSHPEWGGGGGRGTKGFGIVSTQVLEV